MTIITTTTTTTATIATTATHLDTDTVTSHAVESHRVAGGLRSWTHLLIDSLVQLSSSLLSSRPCGVSVVPVAVMVTLHLNSCLLISKLICNLSPTHVTCPYDQWRRLESIYSNVPPPAQPSPLLPGPRRGDLIAEERQGNQIKLSLAPIDMALRSKMAVLLAIVDDDDDADDDNGGCGVLEFELE